jgi:hypothetical protein
MAPPLHACRRRAAVLIAVLAACDTGAGPRSDHAAGPDAALADTLSVLIASAYDFDRPDIVQRMGSLYPDTGQVVSASAGHLATSSDSVRAGIATFWAEAGQNMRDARWQWDDLYAYRLGTNAAVLTGTWSIPHIAPAGNVHVIRGAWTAVFRRAAGSWTIVHEHLSVPPD